MWVDSAAVPRFCHHPPTGLSHAAATNRFRISLDCVDSFVVVDVIVLSPIWPIFSSIISFQIVPNTVHKSCYTCDGNKISFLDLIGVIGALI